MAAALAVAVQAFGGVAGHGGRGAEAQVEGAPVVLTVHPGICLALVSAAPGFNPAVHANDCLNLEVPQSHQRIAGLLGWDGESRMTPAVFEHLAVTGNQMRQFNGTLFFLAFVEEQAPVTFSTTEGTILPRSQFPFGMPPNPGADPAGPVWICDDAITEDPDCVDGAEGADGLVVARLLDSWGDDVSARGPATMSVSQAGLVLDVPFTVVGAPRSVEFHRLKSSVQVGVGDPAADCAVAPPHEGPVQDSLIEADLTAERALVVAIARDEDGTAVTGAFLAWETDDPDRAVLALSMAPTIDLGPLGYGSPNVLCAMDTPGTVTVRAQILRTDPNSGLVLDPLAIPAHETVTFEVVEPAQGEHPCEALPSRASPRAPGQQAGLGGLVSSGEAAAAGPRAGRRRAAMRPPARQAGLSAV
jgi:hypothetical protein